MIGKPSCLQVIGSRITSKTVRNLPDLNALAQPRVYRHFGVEDWRNNAQIAARAREPLSGDGAYLQALQGSWGKEERMPQTDLFEALVLGGGLGKVLAWHLAVWRTAVVEGRGIGGPSPTSPACRIRIRSGARRLRTWRCTALNSVS
jgi:hypothetical protein